MTVASLSAADDGGSAAVRSDRRSTGHAVLLLLVAAAALFGVFCLLGTLLGGPLHDTDFEQADGATDRWFAAHRSRVGDAVTFVFTDCAETITVAALAGVVFLVLRIVLRRWRESLFIAATLGGEVLIFVLTTLVVDRHRPAVPRLDAAPPTSSFPSGHTAASVALYGTLAVLAVATRAPAWLRRIAVTVGILMPVAVAISRVYRGMHFPSDVASGALLGALWLTITWWVLLRGHTATSHRQLLRRRARPAAGAA